MYLEHNMYYGIEFASCPYTYYRQTYFLNPGVFRSGPRLDWTAQQSKKLKGGAYAIGITDYGMQLGDEIFAS